MAFIRSRAMILGLNKRRTAMRSSEDEMFRSCATSFEDCVGELRLRFSSIADVGCGTGRFLRHLLRYEVPMIMRRVFRNARF